MDRPQIQRATLPVLAGARIGRVSFWIDQTTCEERTVMSSRSFGGSGADAEYHKPKFLFTICTLRETDSLVSGKCCQLMQYARRRVFCVLCQIGRRQRENS